jgi:hypothetical protein
MDTPSAPGQKIDRRHVLARLALGPLYQGETHHWNVLRDDLARIRAHYADMGLEVVVDESGGYAYLRQIPEESLQQPAATGSDNGWDGGGTAPLPRILRRTPLSYHQTLFLVLLRERLLRHEQLPDIVEPLYLEFGDIAEMLRPYFPEIADNKTYDGRIRALLRRFDELNLICPVKNRDGQLYRVEPIIKARLPAEEINEIKKRLTDGKESANADGGPDIPETPDTNTREPQN